jgi:hypothetical protein
MRITIVRWPKQKRPTRLRQQWFAYASLIGIARCPSPGQKPLEVTMKLA